MKIYRVFIPGDLLSHKIQVYNMCVLSNNMYQEFFNRNSELKRVNGSPELWNVFVVLLMAKFNFDFPPKNKTYKLHSTNLPSITHICLLISTDEWKICVNRAKNIKSPVSIQVDLYTHKDTPKPQHKYTIVWNASISMLYVA